MPNHKEARHILEERIYFSKRDIGTRRTNHTIAIEDSKKAQGRVFRTRRDLNEACSDLAELERSLEVLEGKRGLNG